MVSLIDMKKTIIRLSGFTLVELMVVIVILGALATMGLSTYQASQQRSRDSKRKADLVQVAKALELFINDCSGFPRKESLTGKIMGCTNACTNVSPLPTPAPCDWGKPFAIGATVYMSTLPKDPSPGFSYSYTTSGKGYLLYARLERTDDPDYDTSLTATCGNFPCTYILRSSNITPKP